jgi:hypothetical protein
VGDFWTGGIFPTQTMVISPGVTSTRRWMTEAQFADVIAVMAMLSPAEQEGVAKAVTSYLRSIGRRDVLAMLEEPRQQRH